MGVEAQIPVIDFSAENDIRAQVRDALEVHGCFLLRYNESAMISLTDKMFEGMKSLFYLPDDTKRMYKSSRAYCSYNGKNPYLPLFESFGVDYAYNIESAQAFTGLMWPEGNSDFCDTINGLSTEMLQAWNNGRLHPVKHKVTLGGNKDRYSIVHYTIPEDGVFVEVPKGLVDNEHPIKYKPLTYNDYMSYYICNVNNKDAAPEDPLEKYAGI